jgi:multidrug resistance efflux pump
MKLPVAFSGGKAVNFEPDPNWMLCRPPHHPNLPFGPHDTPPYPFMPSPTFGLSSATTQQDVDAAAAALRQAQAQVLQAEAQVVQAEPVPQQIGQADTQVGQLKGQVEQAKARLDQALLNLSWMVVTAPQDGWITKRNVEVGDYVTVGQQIFSIVTPEVWITANFKESQLDRMRPGQPATIKLDAYPHLDLRGHVGSVMPPASSPLPGASGSLLPIASPWRA